MASGTGSTQHIPQVPHPRPERGDLTGRRDKRWLFQCDVCGHKRRYRSEFQRHVVQGTGRVGFKIYKAKPSVSLTWVAQDDAGNRYSGHIIDANSPNNAPTGQPTRLIPDPCGYFIRQQRRAERNRRRAAAQEETESEETESEETDADETESDSDEVGDECDESATSEGSSTDSESTEGEGVQDSTEDGSASGWEDE